VRSSPCAARWFINDDLLQFKGAEVEGDDVEAGRRHALQVTYGLLCCNLRRLVISFYCRRGSCTNANDRNALGQTRKPENSLLAKATTSSSQNIEVALLSAGKTLPPVCTADCCLSHASILSLFPHVCCLIGAASYRLSTVIDYERT
jgi:hypothetical protein